MPRTVPKPSSCHDDLHHLHPAAVSVRPVGKKVTFETGPWGGSIDGAVPDETVRRIIKVKATQLNTVVSPRQCLQRDYEKSLSVKT
jgi:hypothetical protein